MQKVNKQTEEYEIRRMGMKLDGGYEIRRMEIVNFFLNRSKLGTSNLDRDATFAGLTTDGRPPLFIAC